MELSLAQLARRGGVSARTVRYYIQRGLLPAPAFRGPDTCYGESHLLGLQAIRTLQAAYWPLDAIASALQGRSLEQLRAIAAGALSEAPRSLPLAAAAPSGPAPRARSRPLVAGARSEAPNGGSTLRLETPAFAAQAAAARQSGHQRQPARLHGTRVTLAPGLELWLDNAAAEPVRRLAEALERWVTAQQSGGEP